MVRYHTVSGRGGPSLRTARIFLFVLPDGETQSSRECFAMFTKETLFDLADHVWSTRYRISLWFL